MGWASRLDAFSGYPVAAWLPGVMPLEGQPVHQRLPQPGPLVLGPAPLSPPAPAADKDQPVSRTLSPPFGRGRTIPPSPFGDAGVLPGLRPSTGHFSPSLGSPEPRGFRVFVNPASKTLPPLSLYGVRSRPYTQKGAKVLAEILRAFIPIYFILSSLSSSGTPPILSSH